MENNTTVNDSDLTEYTEHLEYLDELRESGVVNMFGARPYLQQEFGLSKAESGKVLSLWMDTFSQRHPA
jgi:uncharacterized protein YciI